MLTFFRGRPEKILEALEGPYSDAYERLFTRKPDPADMSRWISLEVLQTLLDDVARRAELQVPTLAGSLTDQGWTREGVTCVVVADAWSDPLRTLSPTVALEAAAQWAENLGPPVDKYTRGALRVRAEKLFDLLRQRKKAERVVLTGDAQELPVQFSSNDSGEATGEASSSSDIAFFAGNGKKIGEALEDGLDTKLRRLAPKSADFSFHLGLSDIDSLARIAAEQAGVAPTPLSESVGRCVAGDADRPWAEREWSADVVKQEWVGAFATLSDDQLSTVAQRWVAQFTDVEEQPLLEAARALVEVCRFATENKLDVVSMWRAG